MNNDWNQSEMSVPESNQQVELKIHFEEELQKAQEATSMLQNDRQVSDETLHEIFTL